MRMRPIDYSFSNKLRKQCPGRNYDRIGPRKAVCVHKRLVEDDLECMAGARRSLSSIRDESRKYHFGVLRNEFSTFLNHGRTSKP